MAGYGRKWRGGHTMEREGCEKGLREEGKEKGGN